MIIVITGATGSGKSQAAIRLAKSIGGEIVNADAFQVYDELSIATAKPTRQMMDEVPHHLFGFVPLNEDYNVARYQGDARRVIEEIISRGHTPIIAGGTGLYIRAALYDYDFSFDPTPIDVSKYEQMDNEALHNALKELDEASSKEIHPNNRVRVMQAIKIALSGRNKSETKRAADPIYDCRMYGLARERENLYPMVERRVDDMFNEGLLEETIPLIEKYGRGVGAFKAIGVKELYDYLDGKETLEEAKTKIKTSTRHYVKRQETFFRHQFAIKWVDSELDILNDLASPN